jgi:hypothetical protein
VGIRQIFGGRQNLIKIRGNAYGKNSWHGLCARESDVSLYVAGWRVKKFSGLQSEILKKLFT